jgi:hypothetical protein
MAADEGGCAAGPAAVVGLRAEGLRNRFAAVLYCLAGGGVAVTCFVPAIPRFFTSGPHVAAAYFALVVIVVAPFIGAPPLTAFLSTKFSCPVNLGVLMHDQVQRSIAERMLGFLWFKQNVALMPFPLLSWSE